MGAKLYADTATKTLVVTLAPDINGHIDINVQVDIWSDLQLDWESTLGLRKHTFPLIAIGGQTISAGKLGTTYVLVEPWQIATYEDDQDLNIDGNLFTQLATTKLVLPTVGGYTVSVNRNLSTLVEVVETLQAAQVDAKLDKIIDGTYGQKLVKHSLNPEPPSGAGDPGYLILYTEDGLTLIGHKEIYQDDLKQIGYQGRGIGWEGPLLAGLP